MSRRRQTPEGSIKTLVLDWLAAEHILAFRMQTGATISEYKGRKRCIRYGTVGMADILAFPHAFGRPHPVWIETKAGKNGQTPEQKSFQEQVREEGHLYILARTLEDVSSMLGNPDGR